MFLYIPTSYTSKLLTWVLTLYVWSAPVDHFGYRQVSIKFCVKIRHVRSRKCPRRIERRIKVEEEEEEDFRRSACASRRCSEKEGTDPGERVDLLQLLESLLTADQNFWHVRNSSNHPTITLKVESEKGSDGTVYAQQRCSQVSWAEVQVKLQVFDLQCQVKSQVFELQSRSSHKSFIVEMSVRLLFAIQSA